MKSRRGFTLVELMVGLMVGSISVLVAAHVATMVVEQAGQGRQQTDFSARTRLIVRQVRQDIRLAGLGSTGLVAIDPGSPLGVLAQNTVTAGYSAMPIVTGLNNVGAIPLGGHTVMPGTDVLQIVVPNPMTRQITTTVSRVNTAARFDIEGPGGTIGMADFHYVSNQWCPLMLVLDHTSPNGAGRAQLLSAPGQLGANVAQSPDILQFTVAAGSEVMCARLTHYFLDNRGIFRRVDNNGALPAGIAAGFVGVGATAGVDTDAVAAGILDFQVSYRFSSEVFTRNGQAVPANADLGWAWGGPLAGAGAGSGNATGSGSGSAEIGAAQVTPVVAAAPLIDDWAEVRQIRINFLARKMRAVKKEGASRLRTVLPREDGNPHPNLQASLKHEWLTASEGLTNLRYFDQALPAGVPAEPY